MKSAQIRESFLKFFERHQHTRVKSSSLIPAADPTLLFTNAGMVQFKDCFLGVTDPGYRRATSCQKCVRAGGKHNDLENVGFTPRHHTFFEMLCNFSFGDYFKKEAIAFAWQFLTQELKIPQEKLRITVFEKDDEALDLWKAQGVRPDWIYRLGEKDNFWAMGDTGPCGPCTEIHYDWGNGYGCGKPDCNPGCECGLRFLEIWNLVFMQFNRDSQGNLTPLPKPSVDTGAGLERLSAVMQGKYSNYDSDVFQPLLQTIAKKVGKTYEPDKDDGVSMRVIADHLRSGTFLIADGVNPSNEGRGYVLRRILRRGIRHGKKLGQERPFLFELVGAVVADMGEAYPELRAQQKMIGVVLKEEEERFHETLHRGMGLLEASLESLQKGGKKSLAGDIAFKLYDTFGFPLDLIEVICHEKGLGVDLASFNQLMEKQRSQSTFNRGDASATRESIGKALESRKWETPFLGYRSLEETGRPMLLFSKEGIEVKSLAAREEGFAIFDKTPFYAESGGQVGDKGLVTSRHGEAKVLATFKIMKAIVHEVAVESGSLALEHEYRLLVDSRARKYTAINHTATHMLHAALRQHLGDRVKQAGSLVEPTRLRFDFTFQRPLIEEEVRAIEATINEEVRRDDKVTTTEMGFDDAVALGALAFFDEKYGDRVRVVRVGAADGKPFSVELCGGTHLDRTGDVGYFKVLSEASVSSGVRRIEAITSETAFRYLDDRARVLGVLEQRLGTRSDDVVKKVEQLQTDLKSLQRENEKLQLKLATGGGASASGDGGGKALWEKKKQIGSVQVVMEQLSAVNPKILRSMVDQVRDKLKEKVVVCLASESEGKAFLCIGLTKDLASTWSASKLVQTVASEVGGTGGGREDFAQAGGTNPGGIPKAFEKLESWLKDQ